MKEDKTAKGTAEEKKEGKAKARSWKVDFIMGIVIAVIGLPFFAVDYKIAGIIMLVIGAFCIVSGLCQKVAKGEEER